MYYFYDNYLVYFRLDEAARGTGGAARCKLPLTTSAARHSRLTPDQS